MSTFYSILLFFTCCGTPPSVALCPATITVTQPATPAPAGQTDANGNPVTTIPGGTWTSGPLTVRCDGKATVGVGMAGTVTQNITLWPDLASCNAAAKTMFGTAANPQKAARAYSCIKH